MFLPLARLRVQLKYFKVTSRRPKQLQNSFLPMEDIIGTVKKNTTVQDILSETKWSKNVTTKRLVQK